MRASVDKLRWGLAGGAVSLLLVLVLVLAYGRYRARMDWKARLNKMGAHISQETDGFTYSQSLQGRTVFTLHAARAVQRGEGKVTLHDVVLTLYGHGRDMVDRIYGAEFEYDNNTGVARAIGDVQMDLHAPGALVKQGRTVASTLGALTDKATGPDIHVRTSGLVYLRKLGMAATDQRVEFRYGDTECTAKGAEFDTGQSIVRLLADVQLTGQVRGAPMVVHAAKADLDRESNVVALSLPSAESQRRKASAGSAHFQLRPDGSIEHGQAEGSVVLQQATRRLTAARAEAVFNGSNLPQSAKLQGGVAIEDSDSARPLHGSAQEVDVAFAPSGAPLHITATGGAQVSQSTRTERGLMLARNVRGDRIEAAFASAQKKRSAVLREVHASGARASADSIAGQNAKGGERKTTQVEADDLRALFAPGDGKTPELQKVLGTGHTRLQQDAPRGEQQTSSGDTLEVAFAKADGNKPQTQIASATQTGHVEVTSRAAARAGGTAPEPIAAGAARSVYDGAEGKLSLMGGAHFKQGDVGLSADSLTLDQRTGDSEAQGNVTADLASAPRPSAGSAAEAAHITANAAHLTRALQVAEFRGTGARPVRMWQGASQIDAASVVLDGKRKTMAARPESSAGNVHAVFAAEHPPTGKAGANGNTRPARNGTNEAAQVERITAHTMDYADAGREATFNGNVAMEGSEGRVRAQHGIVFLAPANTSGAHPQNAATATPFGGGLQRAVMWGEVKLEQPGRTGQGERLVYTAADSSFVLTGAPGKLPQITDAERGSVTGATLLFRTGDNTIIVSGAPGTPAQRERGHLHLETGAKQ